MSPSLENKKEILDLLRNLKGIEGLKELFWSRLSYDRVNRPLSRRAWPAEVRDSLAEDPVVLAGGGAGGAFHVIHARQASDRLLRDPQRRVVEILLRDHPYSLFVFSTADRERWHFLNVKVADSKREDAPDNRAPERRRLFRRFTIGPEERLRTAAERLSLLDLDTLGGDLFGLSPLAIQKRHDDAFDVERVQKDFFRTLDAIYREAIVPDILMGLKNEDKARQAGLILLNRLLFLYFIQKKGWLGGRLDYLARAFATGGHEKKPKSRSFYSDFLWPLFEALSLPKQARDSSLSPFKNIPFLNGGLFEPQTALRDADLKIANATFARLFDDLLEHYNFTVTEDTPLDVEVAVDPEMLGKIFEELVTGRHESGAYYTPRPIVSFMCKEALKGHLAGATKNGSAGVPPASDGSVGVSPASDGSVGVSPASDGSACVPPASCSGNGGRDARPPFHGAIERFVEAHDARGLRNPEAVLENLRAVKVCDPACGSGAYLVGMLQELLALRHCLFAAHDVDPRTDYERKLDIIQNNLNGVDIDPVAVNIARLRLWLSLAVEYESKDGGDPPPLPNLDFKIEEGDSVLGPSPKTSSSTSSRISRSRTWPS